jgi:hypothetical protein
MILTEQQTDLSGADCIRKATLSFLTAEKETDLTLTACESSNMIS